MYRFLPLIPLLLFQCSSSKPDTNESNSMTIADNSRNSLDWVGTYRDTVPAADSPGVVTTLTINEDESYTLATRYLESDGFGEKVIGDFNWQADGNTIELEGIDASERSNKFLVGENKVFLLDRDGQRVEGALAEYYVLPKLIVGLTDNPWQVERIRGQQIDVDRGDQPSLDLRDRDNIATGTGGCNTFRSNYQVVGDRLTFTPVAATKMACPALSTETDYFQALGEVQTYRVDGAELQLLDEQEQVILTFSAL